MQKSALIVESRHIIREGLKELLSEYAEIDIIAEAVSSSEAQVLLEKKSCSIIVLGNSDRWMDEISAVRQIKRKYPRIPIILMCFEMASAFDVNPLRKYADICLPMSVNGNRLANEIQKVSQKSVAGQKGKIDTQTEMKSLDRLSRREFEVLRLMAQGNNNSQIAKQLQLSTNAISTYRHRLLMKLSCENNAQLIWYAIKNELVA